MPSEKFYTNTEIEYCFKSFLFRFCIFNYDYDTTKASINIQNGGARKSSFDIFEP